MSSWPKFRASQWLDTSEESMAQEQANIVYGVQAQHEKGAKWAHVHRGTQPMFFDTPEAASAAIDRLRASFHSSEGRGPDDKEPGRGQT